VISALLCEKSASVWHSQFYEWKHPSERNHRAFGFQALITDYRVGLCESNQV